MFTPAIFTRNHDFWRDPFEDFNTMFPAFFDNGDLEKSFAGFKTDVMEKEGNYVLQAELLKDDILTISASHKEEKKEEDEKTRYIRKERHTSSYSRSFRVANVTHEDIKAAYNNGVLEVTFPKRDALPEKETKKIEIM